MAALKLIEVNMRLRVILFTLFISSYVWAGCPQDSCKTIEEFADSYVNAVLTKDEKLLKSHYHSDEYTCNLDKFHFDGNYTGHRIEEIIELKGDAWAHFQLTLRSEATKIKLFYDFKGKLPDIDDAEIMRMVFKELPKPDLKRVNVPMVTIPSYKVKLDISGTNYHPNHPCWVYTGTSGNLYLMNTEDGYKAIEPLCDVGRAVGRKRINKGSTGNEGEKIYAALTSSQINGYKELLKSGRIATVKRLAKDLLIDYSDAKYVVFEKICPSIP